MKVQVLGTGCARCNKLYQLAEEAIAQTGVKAELVKVEDIDEIMSFGIMMTPGLAIDGEVKSSGKLPKVAQIADWIRGELP